MPTWSQHGCLLGITPWVPRTQNFSVQMVSSLVPGPMQAYCPGPPSTGDASVIILRPKGWSRVMVLVGVVVLVAVKHMR